MPRATPERLSAFSDGVFAVLITVLVLELRPPELPTSGLRDPTVGKALALIHARPSFSWTIEGLARQCGASRTVLAERFMQFVGIPPMHYLAKWRMQVASEMLNRGNSNMATIAAEIGYESEASFRRAFKKMMGVPPSAWRLGVRASGAAYPT